jgi:TonB-dependent receptor
MPKRNFHKSKIALAISSVAFGAFTASTPAFAQGEEKVMEEVVVTGIRSSLKKAMDTKRDAIGVVDAITAEDMGKFPDTNLAESLQRITGVSIDRQRGEGSRVTVRGFGADFNLVTLNGRQMPTHSGFGRSFDFGDLASEGVAGVEVYKTGKANVPTGGIGATINIKTARPLDDPGLKASFGAKAMNDTSTMFGDALTPEFSGIISNTFADDTIGVAITGSYQERNNGQASSSNTEWLERPGANIADNGQNSQLPAADAIVGLPQQIIYTLDEWDRIRTNGHMVLQWAPSESLTATLDYTYAKLELDHRYNNLSAWFGPTGQAGVYSGGDGPVVSPLQYEETNNNPDFPMGAGVDASVNVTKSMGFNLEWAPTEALKVKLDYHDSEATRNPNSPYGSSANLSIATFERRGAAVDYSGDIPVLTLDLSDPLSPDDMMITGSVFGNSWARMDIEQTRLDLTYEFNDSTTIDFGLSMSDTNNFESGSIVQRNSWGKSQASAYGSLSDLLTPASLTGVFDQFDQGLLVTNNFFIFDMEEVAKRGEFLQSLPTNNPMHLSTALAGGDCGTGFCADSDPGFGNRFREETQSAYINVMHSTEVMGYPTNFNVGVRYEQTDVTSSSESVDYVAINWSSTNEFVAEKSDTLIPSSLMGDYDVVLPSFDFDVELTDELKLRGAYSKTIARASYGDLKGDLSIGNILRVTQGVHIAKGQVGNPGLLPHESDNFDLSLEYYYGESSYVSAGWFSKNVVNFVTSAKAQDVVLFPNLAHPALGPLYSGAIGALGTTATNTQIRDYIFANYAGEAGVDVANGVITGVAGRDDAAYFEVDTRINSNQEATIDGFELAIQHDFSDTGFGFIANATFADGTAVFDRYSDAPQFALPGLSDTRNFIAYYDKDGIQVRLAYNWRDTYFNGGVTKPSYTKAYEQWDANVSYEVNENLTVSLEGINLTNETYKTFGRSELQFYGVGQTGPRYNLGVRYTF